MRLPFRALLAVVVLSACALNVQSAPASGAALNVVGNRIVNSHGATVVLRGLNRAGTEGGPGTSGIPVSDSEVGWMTDDYPGSWHARLVRVMVGEAEWTGACPNLTGSPIPYRLGIDHEVQSITRRGAVALIDLHTSTAGCTSIDRHAMPDAPIAENFWSSAAKHYAGNSLVAFELYNEPHYVSDAIWRNGTAKATFQDCDTSVPAHETTAERTRRKRDQAICEAKMPKYRAAGMQDLYNVVTAAAPHHLVVVDGRDYASTPPSSLLSTPHGELAYALHPYMCTQPGPCVTSSNAHAATGVLQRWVPLSKRAPVIVTEFGWPDNTGSSQVDGASYFQDTINFLNAQKPAWGWSAFAFDGSSSGAFALTNSTQTYEPNKTGLPVWNALRSTG